MGTTFNEIDLGRIVGGDWQLICGKWLKTDPNGKRREPEMYGQWLTRKPDGLYLDKPEKADTVWVHHGQDGLVLPFPFTLNQFKAFCDWHPRFEWDSISSVFTNDDNSVDTDALDALDKAGDGAGVLVRYILGVTDAEYLQAWEQHCAIDDIQTKIREISALKAVTITEIQYRDVRLKELADELARLQSAPAQNTAIPAPVSGKKWIPEKLAELAAFRATHTMPETAAIFGISEQRIRELLPSQKPKAKPFAGLIHRSK